MAKAAGIALLGFGITTTQAFAAEDQAPPTGKAAPVEKAAPADKAAAADKAAPADKDAPSAAPDATDAKATADKAAADKDAAVGDCGKRLDKLAAGEVTALDSFDEKRRQALLIQQPASKAVSCLAVAEQNEKFCNLLPKEQKNGCVDQVKVMGSLKGASKDELKARMIFAACSGGKDVVVANCKIVRDAMLAHDVGKCSAMPKGWGPWCAALAASDASKCKEIADEAMQALCAAYAANDAKRCPEDSEDCRVMVKGFSAVADKGVAGLGDPSAVAAVEGKKACADAVAELKKGCSEL